MPGYPEIFTEPHAGFIRLFTRAVSGETIRMRPLRPAIHLTWPWVTWLRLGSRSALNRFRRPAGVAIVVLPAEIDIANSEQVYGLLCAALVPGVDVLVADLTGTTFCDAGGLRAMVRARDRVNVIGAQLRLAVPSSRIRRLLDLINLEVRLPTYSSIRQAVAAPLAPEPGDRNSLPVPGVSGCAAP
jgi:anti-sigma B factor antagonist